MTAKAVGLRLLAVCALSFALPSKAHSAATIVIVNVNAPGVGFNDPTPVAPVGGNAGTTLGQQRLNLFQAAANIWGATLTSTVPILVVSSLEPLTCTATSAVLGSAGPLSVFRDFTGAPFSGTWYHQALANKLAGINLNPAGPGNEDIRARFNSNLGQPGCLTGSPFYLGLDNNHGADIDLLTVLLHELGHGLGFSTVTSGTSGNYLGGFPAAYDHFILDDTTNLTWVDMTNAQRVASAVNARRVVWNGVHVSAAAGVVLIPGTPELDVTAPAGVAGAYAVGTASFGPPLQTSGVNGEMMPVVDSPGGIGLACNPLSGANAMAVNGKIALIDRGTCTFVIKVKNAQDAGAVGVVIADNVAGSPPPGLGGTDPTITIPSVRISFDDGNALKQALRFRSRTHSGVLASLAVNLDVLSGADESDRVLLYTPNPFQSGSSVSHWDTIAFPNLLMEPAINGDLTHSVLVPQDLTFEHLRDLGW
jgi:PA domain